MARIRGKTSKRHRGAVQCSPEGCKFGSEPVVRCPGLDGEASPSDCFLQLRLRAGDVEDAGGARIDVQQSHDEDGIRVIDECTFISFGPSPHGMGTIESVDGVELERIIEEVKLGKRSVNSARRELGYLELEDEHPEDLIDDLKQRISESVDRIWKEECARTAKLGLRHDELEGDNAIRKDVERGVELIVDAIDPRYPKRWKWNGARYVVNEELSGRRDDSGEQPEDLITKPAAWEQVGYMSDHGISFVVGEDHPTKLSGRRDDSGEQPDNREN